MPISRFVRWWLGFALALCTGTAMASPNILLIFADDLGWKDVGFQGAENWETPHIDRLAREGLVFSHAYASAGNCAPSRANLLSGQYGPRHGVYAVQHTARGPRHLQRLIPIPNREDLPLETVTLAEALSAHGYATGLFGKWHLEGPVGTTPQQQGFDVYFNSRPKPNPFRDEPFDPKGIYSLTEATISFMREQRDAGRPFFAFLSHHAIHTALEARPASIAKYRQAMPHATRREIMYAACTHDFDDGVGQVLAALENLGLADDTLVVFTSDNGSTRTSSQEPLRGNKGGYYEGGIREPFVVRWPGRIAAGRTEATPIFNIDFYPTFLAAAGAPVPEGKVLDGADLMPLFLGEAGAVEALAERPLYWYFPGYLNAPVLRGRDPDFRTRPVTVMRQGDWKLHLYHEEWVLDGGAGGLPENRAVELYHLGRDVGEHHDLSGSEPIVRDRMLDLMLAWKQSVPAPFPTEPNPDYRPSAP